MLKKIHIALAIIVVAFLIIVALQPAEYRVVRSAAVTALPDVVFAQINDFHKWEAWSPWAKMDPNAKSSYEGPMAGVGAKMSWAGNMKVGEGSMTIIESQPNNLVRFRLDFLKPMAGTNTAETRSTSRCTGASNAASPCDRLMATVSDHRTSAPWARKVCSSDARAIRARCSLGAPLTMATTFS